MPTQAHNATFYGFSRIEAVRYCQDGTTMNNTEAIQSALRAYCDDQGLTAQRLGPSVGVSSSTSIRWCNGTSKEIRPSHWVVLKPLLERYLTASPPAPVPPPEVRPATRADFGAAVPLIGIAQAADFEAALQSLDDYVHDVADETRIPFPLSRDGDVAVRLEGESMLPWYPPGTILLVRPTEFPQRGDIVVAKLGTGAVVVKRYQRRQNVVTLESLNHGSAGETYTWHVKEQPGFVQWMWPVIQSIRDERALRWQAAKTGQE
jgi:SOS-response transcriptional repressor LexA